jgi:hypothetical protein
LAAKPCYEIAEQFQGNFTAVARKLGLHLLADFSGQQQIILQGWPISVGSKGYNCTTVEEISAPLPHK